MSNFPYNISRHKKNPDYEAGLLGPHFQEFEQKDSPFKKRLLRIKAFASNPHSLTTFIFLFALISFVSNIALGTFVFTDQKARSETALALANMHTQGSDDNDTSAANFSIIPNSHYSRDSTGGDLRTFSGSYLIGDVDSGEVILSNNVNERFPMASVSKLMTAVIAKENLDMHNYATVTKDSHDVYGSEGGLVVGEQILANDLLYALLMESSNDAAEVLATDYGRDHFLTLMNEKAQALNMASTTYTDPSGLSLQNVSSASDLFKLSLYVKKAYPDILDITRVKGLSTLKHTWKNINEFLALPNFQGGKNGLINGGKQSTVSYFDATFKTNDANNPVVHRNVVVIVLKSDDSTVDTNHILSFVSRYVRYVPNP